MNYENAWFLNNRNLLIFFSAMGNHLEKREFCVIEEGNGFFHQLLSVFLWRIWIFLRFFCNIEANLITHDEVIPPALFQMTIYMSFNGKAVSVSNFQYDCLWDWVHIEVNPFSHSFLINHRNRGRRKTCRVSCKG